MFVLYQTQTGHFYRRNNKSTADFGCTNHIIMNMNVHGWVCVFSYFPCYLGLTMTLSFCLFLILILIKPIGYIYNRSLCEVGVLFKTELSYGLLTGFFGLIYVFLYVLKRERPCCVKLFGSILLEINEFVIKLFPFIHFV